MDFEALTTKIAGTEITVPASACMRVGIASNTQKTKQHEACGYIYIVVSCDGETDPPVVYRVPNVAEHLLAAL